MAEITHPNRTELESFVHGKLSEDERQRVESHVAKCDSCCEVLRSVPHDVLVARMRVSDTSAAPGETQVIPGPGPDRVTSGDGIPPELADHSRYRIIKQLGAGGMGVVYQAEHRLMERPVALKVISARLVSSDVAVERFRLEVKAAAKLSHRNIVTAFDAEQAGDLHFLVMEFIEGISLSELVGQRGHLSVLHACNYAMQAAYGLQHALEQGMVHRDIKPHNLMRTPKGTIKILDFGLARFASHQDTEANESGLTGAGATLGTPDYIAPEQARDSRRADIRADIYSLGCTLYYLLSGRVPFPSGTSIEKVVSHCEHDPTKLVKLRDDIPEQVIRIVERMMVKDPDQRFQTPIEVAEALKPFAKPGPLTTGPATIDASADPTESETRVAAARHPRAEPASPASSPDQVDWSIIETVPFRAPGPIKQENVISDARRFLGRYRKQAAVGFGAILMLAGFSAAFPMLRDAIKKLGNGVSRQSVTTIGGDVDASRDGGAMGDWIDLLEQVDPSMHAVAGVWRRTDNGLTVAASESARLWLPYDPPSEYDFEVTFTRNSGSDSIAIHFVAGTGQASFDIDGWMQHLAGIQSIDGLTMQEYSTRVENQELFNGRTYTAMVRVRRGRVDAYLDGKWLTGYEGDGSNLSMIELWQLPSSDAIGVGAYDSATTFHQIRVRPIVSSAR